MSIAFPVLHALGRAPQLRKVQPKSVEKVRNILFGAGVGSSQLHSAVKNKDTVLRCRYCVGRAVTIPMTFIGSCHEYGDDTFLVHVTGLPGAFPVASEGLLRHKPFFSYDAPCGSLDAATEGGSADPQPEEDVQLGLLCVMEALEGGADAGKVLDNLLSFVRRRVVSLRGSETLLRIGGRINDEGLELSFPYHCGGSHALKQYFDVSEEACTLFGPNMKHGTKMLCRYGAAVMVGVAPEKSLGCPVPFWNPMGAPAACLAPVFNGCHVIPVGEVKLEYNGPAPNSVTLVPEDASRYLNPTVDGRFDVTSWLNEGLFGVQVGQPVEEGAVVHGVCYDAEHYIITAMSSPNGGGSLPTSQFGSRGSSPEPPETATLSHIKRQFISSLVGSSAEKGVEARGLLTPPKSLRAEEKETRPSSSDSLSSRPSGGDMCDADIPRTSDELVVFSNEQNHSGGSCEGSWSSDGVRPILLCTLVGGVVASCLKQRLGLVCRVAVSGLGVAKLLCALGYAHVDWGCLFRDLLGIWALSGSDGFLHAIGSALFGSLWRGCAFFGGIIGGFAIL